MYGISRPVPRNCSECPAYVRHEKAYDDPVGCIYSVRGANVRRTDRPPGCVIVDMEDDLK